MPLAEEKCSRGVGTFFEYKKTNTKSVHTSTCDSTDFSFSLVYLFAQISRPPDFDFFIVPVASRFSELNAWTKTQP
eukprot:SAG11_NODE_7217_length_1176_cov_3.472609_1_plen_75_part_10